MSRAKYIEHRSIGWSRSLRACKVNKGYARPRVKTPRCGVCLSMSWRVEGERCSKCGLPYAEEDVAREPLLRSSASAALLGTGS